MFCLWVNLPWYSPYILIFYFICNNYCFSTKKHIFSWERKRAEAGKEGTLGCLLHWSSNLNDIFFLFVGSKTLGFMISRFTRFNVKTFQPQIVIYWRGIFVCNHWGSTSIYQPLSYPFKFLEERDMRIYFTEK